MKRALIKYPPLQSTQPTLYFTTKICIFPKDFPNFEYLPIRSFIVSSLGPKGGGERIKYLKSFLEHFPEGGEGVKIWMKNLKNCVYRRGVRGRRVQYPIGRGQMLKTDFYMKRGLQECKKIGAYRNRFKSVPIPVLLFLLVISQFDISSSIQRKGSYHKIIQVL